LSKSESSSFANEVLPGVLLSFLSDDTASFVAIKLLNVSMNRFGMSGSFFWGFVK
jgi:hypothetical protein